MDHRHIVLVRRPVDNSGLEQREQGVTQQFRRGKEPLLERCAFNRQRGSAPRSSAAGE